MGDAERDNDGVDRSELAAPLEPHRILVVEDDVAILTSIEALLTDEGFSVVTAVNGQEALARLDQQAPRLILLDMKMPVMDGWAFAEVYRRRPQPHAPLIVMTAARDARNWATDIGAEGFIAKPFDVERLLEIVYRHVSA